MCSARVGGLDLTIHKKNQTPDTIYLHGLQQILADFPGFRRIFTDGSKSEDGRVGAAAVMDGRVFTRRLANVIQPNTLKLDMKALGHADVDNKFC
nr:hypothetical protein BaRGS_018426 [Batillaria attramentaria]